MKTRLMRLAQGAVAMAGALGVIVSCASTRGLTAEPSPAVYIHVSPTGDDSATGTAESPFKTVYRAQQAARAALATATGDVVVNLASGVYRLDKPLGLTDADSGRNGHYMVYRSAGGLGKAKLLGTMALKGWKQHRSGIWKVQLPEKMLFHTLYENGRRAHKARFPNYVHHSDFPVARGRYLVTQDGSPVTGTTAPKDKSKEPNWLTYAPGDAPPTTSGPKMKILLFGGGKCNWMRVVSHVISIDPAERRILIDRQWRGIGTGARFFLEDAMGFLDAPGEFYLDETTHTLYYKPMGQGHPDTLNIAAPILKRLIQIKGETRKRCASNIRLEGLALEETDGFPKGWWSMRFGLTDGALVWMGNATNIEIRKCHLKNSGRNGVVMAGHNIGNRVIGCWIESMGLNGVTLSNRWHDRKKVPPILDRSEHNIVDNCRIHNIGEIHTYAACVNVFNVSHNEISHCELYNSVRYAVTVRGNTGPQYGPPINLDYQPGCEDNHMHHLRIYRCGQDGGDMGALHCADLNNPGGQFVNMFEQITVADSRAIPSMKDIGCDGIFLDWPKMAMDQIFSNVHIIRSQGKQLRSNRPENAESARTTNVSWKPGFKTELMDYEQIGLTSLFPSEYGGRHESFAPPPPPQNLAAKPFTYNTVKLTWQAPDHTSCDKPQYTVFRDGKRIAIVTEPAFTDTDLSERTVYHYQVAAQHGIFCHLGPKTKVCKVHTPPDLTRPVVEHIWSTHDGKHVRVLFTKPMSPLSVTQAVNYRFEPPEIQIECAKLVAPNCVELQIKGLEPNTDCNLTMYKLVDATLAENALRGGGPRPVAAGGKGASFPMVLTSSERLLDTLGSAGDAKLFGGAKVEKDAGPFGGPALVLDGKTGYAETSPDFDLGAGDFTLMLWLWKQGGGQTAISKGSGFGSPAQWTFGWPGKGLRDSISLRVNNIFHSSAAGAVPNETWVHIAFVRRGNQGFIYANGKPSGKPHDLSNVGPLTSDEPLRIGLRAYSPNPAYFKGKIAGVKILGHALSAEEIQAQMRPGLSGAR